MIEVTLFKNDSYDSDRTLYINPLNVSSMVKTETRRAYGGYKLWRLMKNNGR